mmetsp:Transcript_13642/g.19929  ORF Transcript_13642/g.19929 Transcript_13642/m.19929 type:complete len:1212 (+) Transcript_13642:24-3659(+)
MVGSNTDSVWPADNTFDNITQKVKGLNLLKGHTNSVKCLKAIKHGKHLASGSLDGTVRIWNVARMQEEAFLESQSGSVECMVAIDHKDYLVAGHLNGTIRIWNAHQMQEEALLEGHSEAVECLEVLEKDKYLASGSKDNTVRIWNLQTMKQEAVFEGHSDTINCLTLVNAGKHLASGSSDKTVRIWNLQTMTEETVFKGHTDSVYCLAPLGKYLASGSYDAKVRLWNLQTMKEEAIFKAHVGSVNCLAAIGKYLASGSRDNNIVIWDIEKMQQEAVFEGHSNGVLCFSVLENNILASGSLDGTVRIWDLQNMNELVVLEGHSNSVECLEPLQKGLASGSKDNTLRIWNLKKEQSEFVLEGHSNLVYRLAAKGKYLFSGAFDSTVRAWNLETMQQEALLEGHTDFVYSLKVAGKYLVSGSYDSKIIVWNLETMQLEKVFTGHTATVRCFEAIEKGKYLISGSFDSTIKVWNLQEMREECVLTGHSNTVWCFALFGEEKYLASGSFDNTVIIWNLETMQQEATLQGHSNNVYCLAVAGKYLASGSGDNTVRVWNLEKMQEEGVLEGHSRAIEVLEVVGNGKYLASGSFDNTVIIWNLQTMKQEALLGNHLGAIRYLCALEGGKYLASASRDATIRIWNLQTMQQEAILEGHSDSVEYLIMTGNYLVSASVDTNIRVNQLKHDYRGSLESFITPLDSGSIAAAQQLFSNETKNYNGSINSVLIKPEKLNPLHFFSFYNKIDLVNQALEKNCPFVKSAKGETPISIALYKNSRKALDAFLNHIVESKNNFRQDEILAHCSQDLPGVIESSSSLVKPLCEALTVEIDPEVVDFTESLPYFYCTEHPVISKSEVSSAQSKPKNVVGGQTKFKYNFLEGSTESLELLKALGGTSSTEALRSGFVQALVGYKWRKFSVIIGILAFLSLLNLCLLVGMVFYDQESIQLRLAQGFVVLNVLFVFYESLQILALKLSYFKEWRNYLDLARIGLSLVLGIYTINEGFGIMNSSNWLTIAVSVLSWFEGVIVFKVLGSTRHYMELISSVAKDILPFLGILFYFVVAYCSVVGTTHTSDFLSSFKTSYELLLGNFNTSSMDDLQWFFLFFGGILNLIVMLNLLISIISESFDKVSFTLKEAETRIRLGLIIEIENCMFWNRNKGVLSYLTYFYEYSGEEEIEWESRVRKLYNDTQDIKSRITEMQETFKAKFEEMNENFKNFKVV